MKHDCLLLKHCLNSSQLMSRAAKSFCWKLSFCKAFSFITGQCLAHSEQQGHTALLCMSLSKILATSAELSRNI